MPQIDTDKTMFSRGFSRSETDFINYPSFRKNMRKKIKKPASEWEAGLEH